MSRFEFALAILAFVFIVGVLVGYQLEQRRLDAELREHFRELESKFKRGTRLGERRDERVNTRHRR